MDSLFLEDILPGDNDEDIDLKSMFTTLEAIRTEVRQMNRTEKLRLDAFKTYFDEEKSSKRQLLDDIGSLVSKVEYSEQKSILMSIIETRDFIEAYHQALPLVFKRKNPLFSLWNKLIARQAFDYVNENVAKTLKKIDQLLEKAGVYAVDSNDETFDPATMMAVDTASDKNRPDRAVLETVEKGYLHQDKVLRLARVKVNKIEATD